MFVPTSLRSPSRLPPAIDQPIELQRGNWDLEIDHVPGLRGLDKRWIGGSLP